MTVILNPYLNFRDQAKAAAEFYHSVFGGDLTISTFAELGAGGDVKPDEAGLIMHSELKTAAGFTLMISDTPSHMDYSHGTDMSISLSGGGAADKELLTGYWNKLVEGGEITQPLVEALWGDTFGMVTDKFGVRWLVNIAAN